MIVPDHLVLTWCDKVFFSESESSKPGYDLLLSINWAYCSLITFLHVSEEPCKKLPIFTYNHHMVNYFLEWDNKTKVPAIDIPRYESKSIDPLSFCNNDNQLINTNCQKYKWMQFLLYTFTKDLFNFANLRWLLGKPRCRPGICTKDAFLGFKFVEDGI